MKPILKMKPKNTKGKAKTASILSTASSGGTSTTSDQQSNTCHEYFKVKKSPVLSGDSKDHDTAPETRGGSVIADKVKIVDRDLTPLRPRRARTDSLKQSPAKQQASSGLSIEDVQMLVEAQGSFEGGVNCPVCGKLYKSKVCFIKHIWEHTVYWDVFDSAKNHERVLSIQAAIILYSGMGKQTNGSSKSDLCNLLVASPHSPEMKQEKDSGVTPKRDVLNSSFLALLSEKCAENSPVVVEYGRKQSDNAVENSLHNGASKHTAIVTTGSQTVISNSLFQMPSTSRGECWRQSSPLVGCLQSEMLPISQAHSTLSSLPPNLLACPALFLPPAKPQPYPVEISPREKLQFYLSEVSQIPHNYPADLSLARPFHAPAVSSAKPQTNPIRLLPQIRPHYFPTLSLSPLHPGSFHIFSSSLPNTQTYRTSEGIPALMPATSLPAPQLSSDACREYKNSRHPLGNTYVTLESNKVSIVSPVKRKHED